MATEKQIAANRKNALKSPGPTSVTGKMISSRNSTRHGFYATSVLLPDEDREEFIRFARRLVMAYAPCGVLQEELVRTVIETRWQLRRANLVDTELYQMYRFYEGEQRGVGTAFAQDATQANAFSKLARYEGFLLKKLQGAKNELENLRANCSVRPTADLSLPDAQNSPVIPGPKTPALSQGDEPTPLQVLEWLKRRDTGLQQSK